MLEIHIPSKELYDEKTETFSMSKAYHLQLEHSLISISKWESKWLKAFLSNSEKTIPETIDYIRCMTVNANVNPEAYTLITNDIVEQVSAYIEAPMTATTFSKSNSNTINREIVTSEIIYYWMVTFNIPFECEKWHLNRLLAFINVCNIKNQPTKKVGKKELYSRNTALNAMRRQQLNTTG
jgi:hypothetical protein